MTCKRRAGILLHPTSLPGPPGVGDIGPCAHDFLATLHAANQSVWQVLPLGPTGYRDSPYQTLSAFAGNPTLVSPEPLVDEGLLAAEDLELIPNATPNRVDYGSVIQAKDDLLSRAWLSFRSASGSRSLREDWNRFRDETSWLHEYSLFAAIHAKRRTAWIKWPKTLAARDATALTRARRELADEIERAQFIQFLFFRQWGALRRRANELGIQVMGDVPLYVAHDSADVWANRDQFDLDDRGRLNRLSGVPPDAFSDDGQLWGNPVYRWSVVEEDGFDWWIRRVRAAIDLFDSVRIDHFRGFSAGWTVPAGEKTARAGRWDPGPGAALFEALENALGKLPLIAEDLGVITPEVSELRDRFGFPGMRILLFGFEGEPESNPHHPDNHIPNSIVYTGTHDNDTVLGWWEKGASIRGRDGSATRRDEIRKQLDTDGSEIWWDFVEMAHASRAETAIVPAQDILGLDNRARMNSPGRAQGNWAWRIGPGQWSEDVTDRLAQTTRKSTRA